MIDMCTNLWCNNFKANLFIGSIFFDFDIFFISPKNACFRCALYGEVTAIFSLFPKYTVQNHFWNKQVHTKLINTMVEKNLSHRSSLKSKLCNVAMRVSLLLPHNFIFICPFWFDVTLCLYETTMYLSVYSNEPEIKS